MIRPLLVAFGCWLVCAAHVLPARAAETKLFWPLGRTAYQTNEWIDLAVVRSNAGDLAAGDLILKVASAEGSELAFTFPAPAVKASGDAARRTEHLHLNAWLLRPGKYAVTVTCDGASAASEFEIFTHVRQSDFKLINWGRATKPEHKLIEGENGLGFNLIFGHYTKDDDANFLRGGCDIMACCVMSGGHQMDLRQECDWSDPLVVRGGTQRVAQRAFIDRTRPNVPGVHFYDEPGLTWEKDAESGETTPHAVPSQHRAFEFAFDEKSPHYRKVDPNNPADVAHWKKWARWKLGFMDAAWKDAQFGVSYVRPDYLSVTQSQYGFSAYTDGYYFNVARSLPIVSGHGGYHDYGLGLFNPSLHLEIARARDFDKPCWYLPTWYGNTTSDEFRAEQYLAFQTNIQGLNSPPDIDPFEPHTKPAAQGVVESNKLAARLGPIFNHLPVTRPPVAMLFSLSHLLDKQTKDRSVNYSHAEDHGANLYFTYLAGKLMQHQFLTVVEEDIVDGTLAAHHKAVILTSIDFLPPEVIAALEDFIKQGGVVLLTSDCEVKIAGGIDLGMTPAFPDADKINALRKAGKHEEANKLSALRQSIPAAQKMADAIRPHLTKAGIEPPLMSDQPGITVTRQASGDMEYIFAVNATHDFDQGHPNTALKSVSAKLTFPNPQRPVYDAIHGGLITSLKNNGSASTTGEFRFGPGQVRVFARPRAMLGQVRTSTPVVVGDSTRKNAPRAVEIGAVVLDNQSMLLSGPIPLKIRVVDPFGAVRYELFRSTDINGQFRMQLPLAANDPPGTWQVFIGHTLAAAPFGSSGARFHLRPVTNAASAAGSSARAISFRGESDHVFRFFRTYQDVTIVTGASEFHKPAAERLTKALATWGIRAKTIDAASVNKPRSLSPEQARTWVGIEFGRAESGEKNSPLKAGFAIDGPVVLLGTPEDNPLIEFLRKNQFLPYAPDKDNFPGAGRGYYAWQRDAIGPRQESLTLIAYDAAGLSEAVGSVYEAASGLEPLTPFALPSKNVVVPTSKPQIIPEARLAARVTVPDRVDALGLDGENLVVLSHDGTLLKTTAADFIKRYFQLLDPAAAAAEQKRLTPGPNPEAIANAQKRHGPTRLVKFVTPHGDGNAVVYWGGTIEYVDASGAVQWRNRLDQDITAVIASPEKVFVGLADGQVLQLVTK